MESLQTSYNAKLGGKDDFAKLEPLMRVNCEKLALPWENYSVVANRILSDQNLGKFVFVEDSANEVVAFLFVTYEWSDWRDGLFFWLQGIELKEGHDDVLPLLKDALESYASKELGYRYCGLRLCSEKTKSKHFV